MGTIEPWQILAAGGLLLAIAEFFTPTFFSLPAGIAFLATSVFALFIHNWTALLLILAIHLGVVYWVFHSFVWPRLHKHAPRTNADAMTGKIGIVSEDIDPKTGAGYVRLYGDTWRVVAKERFTTGTKVMILGTVGNKVVIRALTGDEG